MTNALRCPAPLATIVITAALVGCGDRVAPEWGGNAELEAPDITSDALWLTWPEATDEVGVTAYSIRIGDEVIAEPSPADERRLLVESLVEFSDVSISVTATDEAGNVSEPLSAVFRTLDVTPPVGVEGCEVTGTETVTDDRVTAVSVTWCEAADNDRVDRFEVSQLGAPAATLDPDARSHEFTGEDLSGTVTVKACDPSGNCGSLGSYRLVEADRLFRQELERQVVESSGILAALSGWDSESAFGSSGLSADVWGDGELEGIGGLIGAQGVTFGSGGLGSRGSGLGGGGTAEGLGGLGTRGGGGTAVGYGGLGTRGSYTPPSAKLSSGGDGGLLRDHVSRRLGRIENCYSNRLRDESGLSGTLTVSLAADADGAVTVQGVGGVDDAELTRCASTALRGRLAEPPGEPLTGAFGVVLSPGSR